MPYQADYVREDLITYATRVCRELNASSMTEIFGMSKVYFNFTDVLYYMTRDDYIALNRLVSLIKLSSSDHYYKNDSFIVGGFSMHIFNTTKIGEKMSIKWGEHIGEVQQTSESKVKMNVCGNPLEYEHPIAFQTLRYSNVERIKNTCLSLVVEERIDLTGTTYVRGQLVYTNYPDEVTSTMRSKEELNEHYKAVELRKVNNEMDAHQHKCEGCLMYYVHKHKGGGIGDHPQHNHQCPNPSCKKHYMLGNSAARVNATHSRLTIAPKAVKSVVSTGYTTEIQPKFTKAIINTGKSLIMCNEKSNMLYKKIEGSVHVKKLRRNLDILELKTNNYNWVEETSYVYDVVVPMTIYSKVTNALLSIKQLDITSLTDVYKLIVGVNGCDMEIAIGILAQALEETLKARVALKMINESDVVDLINSITQNETYFALSMTDQIIASFSDVLRTIFGHAVTRSRTE